MDFLAGTSSIVKYVAYGVTVVGLAGVIFAWPGRSKKLKWGELEGGTGVFGVAVLAVILGVLFAGQWNKQNNFGHPPGWIEPPVQQSNYSGTGHSYPDQDCGDPGVGTNIPVGASDPNGFDGDGDGVGCET